MYMIFCFILNYNFWIIINIWILNYYFLWQKDILKEKVKALIIKEELIKKLLDQMLLS